MPARSSRRSSAAPSRAIRVRVPDVGGAFGSKGTLPVETPVVALAAERLGRPVKWAEDRYENFVSAPQGRGQRGALELALDADGRILALRGRILADLGAYLLPSTPIPPHTTAMLLSGCYDIGAVEVFVTGVRTNRVPTGPYRGAGRPGGDVPDRDDARRRRARARDRPDRAAPPQPRARLPAPDRARLDV